MLTIIMIIIICLCLYFSLKTNPQTITNDDITPITFPPFKSIQTTTLSIPNNILSTNLYPQLSKPTLFSPLGITFSLSLLHQSAQNNTNQELTNTLTQKYTLTDLNNIYNTFNNDTIKMSNSIIINNKYTPNQKYLNQIKSFTQIEHGNFNNNTIIANNINQYTKTNTNGLITNIIKPNEITDQTILIIINAIYFKSNWLYKFNPHHTTKYKFYKNKTIKMMYTKNEYKYYENDKMQILEMSYVDTDYCMDIILPKSNTISPISINKFNHYIGKLKQNDIIVYLPKFTCRKNIKLIQPLQKLGINDLFTQNAKLDLVPNAYISSIIQEAVVIVDESGTEASAVTKMIMTENCASPMEEKIVFKADHPFIYCIRHIPSNMIFFYGDYYGDD